MGSCCMLLMSLFSEMAVKAFNNCIIPDKVHGPNDEEFSVTFIYEFIDDDYSMTNWVPEPSGTSIDGSTLETASAKSPENQSDLGSLKDGVSLAGEAKVYVDADPISGRNPHVLPEANKYVDSTKTLINNHPLSVMVRICNL